MIKSGTTSMTGKKFICLAAGGTGGHVFPALAVAETLQAQGHQTLLFTDRRGAAMVSGTAFACIAAASPFQPGLWRRLRALVLLSSGALVTALRLLAKRPAVMIGFGGYPSFAPLLMAWILRIPTLVHEQNAFLGRANRLLAKRAGHLALSWQDTANLPDGTHCVTSGMPVRRAFFDHAGPTATKSKSLHLTVLGGSLGAGIFADLLPPAIAALPASLRARLRLTQQCRAAQIDTVRTTYKAMGVDATMAPFFDDIPGILATSHLVIGRAGASSVAELAAAGKPAILIPLPQAMDDHQSANAAQLVAVGGGLCLSEADLTADELAQMLTQMLAKMLGDTDALVQMGRRARALAMPDAAANIAAYAVALAEGRTPELPAGRTPELRDGK
jgi:UDP-N-acetylglucosamine--N-acetylmuramyl-(pentapeptide) pyrophosphoryl-undecaprenol N-acetylglucosamine transferase